MEPDGSINKFVEHYRVDDGAYHRSRGLSFKLEKLERKQVDIPRAEPEEIIPTAKDLFLWK